jgi:hypothetical protein
MSDLVAYFILACLGLASLSGATFAVFVGAWAARAATAWIKGRAR